MKVEVGQFLVRKRGAIAAMAWEKSWEKTGEDPYTPKEVKKVMYSSNHVSFQTGPFNDVVWWRAENFLPAGPNTKLEDWI